MTRTISLITATVGAALLFAVPAYGDNWAADKAQPTAVSPDWFERAAAAATQKQGISTMLDARERSFAAKQNPQLVASQVPDWFERAAATAIRDNRVPVVDDRFTIDPTSGPSPVTVGSGREIEWPQVGIGLGIGLLLALGLFLAMRHTRIRTLAH